MRKELGQAETDICVHFRDRSWLKTSERIRLSNSMNGVLVILEMSYYDE